MSVCTSVTFLFFPTSDGLVPSNNGSSSGSKDFYGASFYDYAEQTEAPLTW